MEFDSFTGQGQECRLGTRLISSYAFRFRDPGSGIRDSGFGIWDLGFGFRGLGCGLRSSGSGVGGCDGTHLLMAPLARDKRRLIRDPFRLEGYSVIRERLLLTPRDD